MTASENRTAFVTGATGFLGRHLVEELCRAGWRVTALCLPADATEVLPGQVKVVTGDITDIESVLAGMPTGVDTVFHVAGNTSTWRGDAARQDRDNVTGTGNVVEAARHRSARRLVYTSSVSAYGYRPGQQIDEHTPSNAPTHGDNYGRSKLRAEQRIRRETSAHPLDAVILNPVNILGPYDRNNWSRQLILPIAEGRLRAVPPGSGTWAYVGDVVDAHIAAARKGRPGENYILGGVEASFADVVAEIGHILGIRPPRHTTPKLALRMAMWAGAARSRIDGRPPALTRPAYRRAIGDLRCDDGKARRELGYRHTDLSTMLAETIGWLRRENLLDGGMSR